MAKSYLTVRFVSKDLWLKVSVGDDLRGPVRDLLKRVLSLVNANSSNSSSGGELPLSPTSSIPVDREMMDKYGFYSVTHRYWLESDRSLADYKLRPSHSPDTHFRDGDILELQCRTSFVQTGDLLHYAEGSLLKKGSRSLVWKSRLFVLRNYRLSFFKDRRETGHIDLTKRFRVKLVQGPISDQINIELHISTQEKVYRLTSDDIAELRHWIRILRSLQGRLHSTMLSQSIPVEVVIDDQSSESSFDSFEQSHQMPPPSYGASDGLTSSDGRNGSFISTFKHMRLSDAMSRRKDKNATSTGAVNEGDCPYADIQGDKIGFLYKKGQLNKSLKYRLFVLRDKILYYYKLACESSDDLQLSNTSYKYAGMINLEGSRIFSDNKEGKKAFIFRIVTPARVYLLSTNHQEEWEDWKDAFEYIGGVFVEDMQLSQSTFCEIEDELIAPDGKPYKTKLKLDYAKHGSPDYCGYMYKQGNDRIGKWRKRWFIVLGRTLFYCESPTSEPLGSIPLRISSIETNSSSASDYTFNIVVKNADISLESLRKFKLKAVDEQSYLGWLEKLELYIGKP
eukprot:Partr_v1_DN28873_c0_g1_i1_m33154